MQTRDRHILNMLIFVLVSEQTRLLKKNLTDLKPETLSSPEALKMQTEGFPCVEAIPGFFHKQRSVALAVTLEVPEPETVCFLRTH